MKEVLISIIVPVYNVESKIKKLLDSLYNILLYKPSLSNKIFKKELINKKDFIFTEIGEDMYITLPILASTNNIEYIDNPIYNYVRDNNSVSNRNSFQILENCIKTLKLLKIKFIENNIYKKQRRN